MKLTIPEYMNYKYPECFDGWNHIIQALINAIDIMDKDNNVRIQQIKEKFGTLRFYVSGATEEMYKIIHSVEGISSEICEKCGAPGSLRGDNWIFCRCNKCWNEMQREKNEKSS